MELPETMSTPSILSREHFDTADFIHQAFRDDLNVRGGVLSEDCSTFYLKPDETAPADPAQDVTSPPSLG